MLVVEHPLLRQGKPLHETAMRQISELGLKNVRYLGWTPYPRLGVAELEPPTATKTSWDFSLIDPDLTAFLDATRGHEPMVNYCLIRSGCSRRKSL